MALDKEIHASVLAFVMTSGRGKIAIPVLVHSLVIGVSTRMQQLALITVRLMMQDRAHATMVGPVTFAVNVRKDSKAFRVNFQISRLAMVTVLWTKLVLVSALATGRTSQARRSKETGL
jgi:hypothetical protein|tara:strand:- start:584 stop:940 length:357 start_codon:yes stop_codon:yes gene_type:complete